MRVSCWFIRHLLPLWIDDHDRTNTAGDCKAGRQEPALKRSIPMRVDMFKLYTHHINVHRKTRKLYTKKVGIRRPPQTIKGKHETGNCDHRKFILHRNKQLELRQQMLDQRPFCRAPSSQATSV